MAGLDLIESWGWLSNNLVKPWAKKLHFKAQNEAIKYLWKIGQKYYF